MQGVNKVFLLGHLGADPELRFTQGGQAVLNMRVATTESYLDKDKVRRERTDWHNVVMWGKRAEGLAKFLHKGAGLHIEGSLRTSSYDDRDGIKRYKTEVQAHNVIYTDRRGASGGGDDASAPPADFGGDYDGGPRQQAPQGSAPRGGATGGRTASQAAGSPDDFGYGGGDDIPF